jgi:putative ABC transport system permease protein
MGESSASMPVVRRPANPGFEVAWGISFVRLKRTVRLGFKSLWLHRLRSLLTVLGIVFGVCSVIAMLAIGEGAKHEALEQIKNLGSQNIILYSVKPPEEQKVTGNQSYALEYGLTYPDIKRIRATIPGVTVVVHGRIIREYAWNISRRVDCEILGTVPWYPQMRNHPVARGRFFSEVEMEDNASVCVLGAEMVPRLFPFEEPIGATLRVGSQYYRIIGIMQPRSKAAKESESPASATGGSIHRLYIPLSTARTHFGETLMKRRAGSFEAEKVALHEVTVKVDNRDEVVNVSLVIKDLLERYHKKADYQMVVPLEMLKQAERTKRIFTIVLGSIAAISLLVGGIGIMNIMLASVTERTREIGIRRALGAKRRDIVVQFLVETVILSGAGGLIGVALWIAIPCLVTVFAKMDTIVTLWSPLLAFSISALVGVVFGLYPAFRAANMDPVEALRHE